VSLLASIPSPSTGALHLGPLQLRAYGLCIALGAFAGVRLAAQRYVSRGGKPGLVESVAWWAVPAGLVGARLYHVATDWRRFQGRWLDAAKIWQGGLGIWGGVALGTIVGLIVARREGAQLRPLMDAVAPSLPLAQAIGRWGNWFNQELFGRPTDLPWGLRIDSAHRPEQYGNNETFHPIFLYESLWCLGIVGVILFVEKRVRLRAGQAFALYVALYTLGRWYFETLRVDEATHVGGFRINEIVAPTVLVLAVIAFVVLGRRPQPEPPDASEASPSDEAEVGVEGEREAAAPAAGLEELADVDLDGGEAPGLELPADAGRAAGHDDGAVDHD
jgi:prolipoprotein diacylglyceryl transferase